MKLTWILILVIVGLTVQKPKGNYRVISNDCFTRGEKINFRVHYGFINAGEAVMQIDKKIYTINGRPCYKVDIFGSSTGVFDMVIRIRNNWGSYLDTAAIVSQQSYRYIEEGRYRKKEMINFDHSRNVAVLNKLDRFTGILYEKVEYKVPENILDLVSGYYYLRTFDYNKMKIGTEFTITGFFDKETYNMRIRYLGKEKVKTKLGEYDALVLTPVMPQNKLFDGENSIKVWLSDDKYKIPLKIRANMFVGAVEIDISKYEAGNGFQKEY
jgi:hypothetical protein